MNTEEYKEYQKGLKITDVKKRIAIAFGVAICDFILLLILYAVASK